MTELPNHPAALVVDDEPALRTLVEYALTSQGFDVTCASSSHEAWELLQVASYDVVILDVVMPGVSGTTLCARIRQELDVPVILLTALGEAEHRIQGLEAGADDYVVKPFHPRELALRAKALIRRSHHSAEQVVVNGPLEIDPVARRVLYYGQAVHLSESEYRVCSLLAERAGRAVTHEELIDALWGSEDALGGREMLKTVMWRLRWRLGQIHPEAIVESVRGIGYSMLRLAVTTSAPE